MTERDGNAMPGVLPPRARRILTSMALTLSGVLPAEAVLANDLIAGAFDPQTLSRRGIDPELANLLLQAPRFAAGRHAVNVTVNGQRRGRVDVEFDHQGGLCFSLSLIHI